MQASVGRRESAREGDKDVHWRRAGRDFAELSLAGLQGVGVLRDTSELLQLQWSPQHPIEDSGIGGHSLTSPCPHLTQRAGASGLRATPCLAPTLQQLLQPGAAGTAAKTATPCAVSYFHVRTLWLEDVGHVCSEALVPLGAWVWLPPCMIRGAPSWRASLMADARPCFRQSSKCPLLHGALLASPWGAPTPPFSGPREHSSCSGHAVGVTWIWACPQCLESPEGKHRSS